MTSWFAVDPDSVISVAQGLRTALQGAQPGLRSLSSLAKDHLGSLRCGEALLAFCQAWMPVHVELLEHGERLIDALSEAGGDYVRIDRALTSSVGSLLLR